MGKCALCGREDVSLLMALHKKYGYIMICTECWKKNWHDLLPYGGGERSCCE